MQSKLSFRVVAIALWPVVLVLVLLAATIAVTIAVTPIPAPVGGILYVPSGLTLTRGAAANHGYKGIVVKGTAGNHIVIKGQGKDVILLGSGTNVYAATPWRLSDAPVVTTPGLPSTPVVTTPGLPSTPVVLSPGIVRLPYVRMQGTSVIEGNVVVNTLVSPNPLLPNGNPGILNRQIFSADSQLLQTGQNGVHYLYRVSDGALLRKMSPNDPTRTVSWTRAWFAALDPGFWPWDARDPRYYYAVSWNDPIQPDKTLAYGTPNSYLYRIDASNGDIATVLLALPNPTRRKELQGGINSSSNMLLVRDVNPPAISTTGGVPAYIPDIYMVDLTTGKLVQQYAINTFGAAAPCHNASTEYHLHDIGWMRDRANHFTLNYGPQGDVGEGCVFAIQFNGAGSKIWYPDSTAGQPYLSHPALDSEGATVAYDGQSDVGSNKWGSWIRGTWAGEMYSYPLVPTGPGSGHTAWDAVIANAPFVFDGYVDKATKLWGITEADPMTGVSQVLVTATRDPANTVLLISGPSESPDGHHVIVFYPDDFTPLAKAPIKARLITVQ